MSTSLQISLTWCCAVLVTFFVDKTHAQSGGVDSTRSSSNASHASFGFTLAGSYASSQIFGGRVGFLIAYKDLALVSSYDEGSEWSLGSPADKRMWFSGGIGYVMRFGTGFSFVPTLSMAYVAAERYRRGDCASKGFWSDCDYQRNDIEGTEALLELIAIQQLSSWLSVTLSPYVLTGRASEAGLSLGLLLGSRP